MLEDYSSSKATSKQPRATPDAWRADALRRAKTGSRGHDGHSVTIEARGEGTIGSHYADDTLETCHGKPAAETKEWEVCCHAETLDSLLWRWWLLRSNIIWRTIFDGRPQKKRPPSNMETIHHCSGATSPSQPRSVSLTRIWSLSKGPWSMPCLGRSRFMRRKVWYFLAVAFDFSFPMPVYRQACQACHWLNISCLENIHACCAGPCMTSHGESHCGSCVSTRFLRLITEHLSC